jgi:hypothetical protein
VLQNISATALLKNTPDSTRVKQCRSQRFIVLNTAQEPKL